MDDGSILRLLPKERRPINLEVLVNRIERLGPVPQIGKLTCVINDYCPNGYAVLVKGGKVVDVVQVQDLRKNKTVDRSAGPT